MFIRRRSRNRSKLRPRTRKMRHKMRQRTRSKSKKRKTQRGKGMGSHLPRAKMIGSRNCFNICSGASKIERGRWQLKPKCRRKILTCLQG